MPLSTLQETPRDVPSKTRGQDGFATSFPVGLLHPLQHAGLSRRSLSSPSFALVFAELEGFSIAVGPRVIPRNFQCTGQEFDTYDLARGHNAVEGGGYGDVASFGARPPRTKLQVQDRAASAARKMLPKDGGSKRPRRRTVEKHVCFGNRPVRVDCRKNPNQKRDDNESRKGMGSFSNARATTVVRIAPTTIAAVNSGPKWRKLKSVMTRATKADGGNRTLRQGVPVGFQGDMALSMKRGSFSKRIRLDLPLSLRLRQRAIATSFAC